MAEPTQTPVIDNAVPTPSSAEHDAAMAAKFDQRQAQAAAGESVVPPPAQTPGKPERPAHIPEKFWDAEKGAVRVDEMAKSYAELEKARAAAPKPDEKPAEGAPKTDPVVEVPANLEEAQKVAEAKGVDYAAATAEFAEKGELSAETYAKLEAAGLPKAKVDEFIAGQIAQAQVARTEILKDIGGEEAFGAVVTWAQKNVPAAELAAYNKIVEGNDLAATKLAVQGLYARYSAINGQEPELVKADTLPAAADVYESVAQVKADMASQLYAKDPAFRAKVQAKIGRSNVL